MAYFEYIEKKFLLKIIKNLDFNEKKYKFIDITLCKKIFG